MSQTKLTDKQIVTSVGTASRTLDEKLGDVVSIKDFGAVGDGVTDDTAAITAAEASSEGTLYVPEGAVLTTKTNFNSLNKRYVSLGGGKIDTTAGKVPPFFSKWDSAPTLEGDHSSLLTAFDGDTSSSIFHIGQSVRNNAVDAGISAYKFVRETCPVYVYTFFQSGSNTALDDADGRTAYVQNQGTISHDGQGDAIVHHANVVVTSTKPGATHFLANPAGVLYGGSVTAGNDLCNLTVGEITLTANSYDCRGTGFVINFDRDSATSTLSNFWSGQRLNSRGAAACDSGYQVLGNWKTAFDSSTATISGAAIALAQNQKIEFHAEAPADSAGVKRYAETLNGWDMRYNSAVPGLEWRTAGTARLRLSASGLALIGAGSNLVVSGGSATFSGGSVAITGYNLNMGGSITFTSNETYNFGTAANHTTSAYSKNFHPGAGTATWTSGTGSPEGVLTAVVGSMYTRTDGGAGTTLYVKESGTGNTGWVAK